MNPQDLARWAASVTYVGSAEHKTSPSFAGPAKIRSDATRCPTHLKDASTITGWLRAGIEAGNVSDVLASAAYPRYVWAFQEGTLFEGRLTNGQQGQYKGYPLAAGEAPREATR